MGGHLQDDAGESRLTRSELLARGGIAGLGLLGADAAVNLLGGAADASAAGVAAKPLRVRRFVTRRDLRPPILTIRHPARGAAEGYLFIAPSSGPGQRGTLIFDNDGEPIWFHPTGVTATAFRTSTLNGKPVLTWWEGTYSNEGLGRGAYVILDSSYRQVARIHAGGYWDGDLHEFHLTRAGTALVTKNRGTTQDLSAYGGSAGGLVYGGVVQEIEIPSGRVLHEWNSLDHVALERVLRPTEREPFRLLPHQLDRGGRRRASARLGAEHLGRLQGAPPHRQGALAARRAQERLRDGEGNGHRLAARRALARRAAA